MNFQETIQLKALELKQLRTEGISGSVGDRIIEEMVKTPERAAITRNICAHISVELFEQVEQCCQQLSLSKRRFVEMALKEALNQAESIVAEIDPFVED